MDRSYTNGAIEEEEFVAFNLKNKKPIYPIGNIESDGEANYD
jgi:hypothetical protein